MQKKISNKFIFYVILVLLFNIVITANIFPQSDSKKLPTPSYTMWGDEIVPYAEKVLYKKTPQEDMYLYILRPENQTKKLLPAIVYFTGGGWKTGKVQHQITNAAWFRDQGIIGITADYRVERRHGTTPIESIKDAKSALRYINAHAEELGIDPDRIIAAGSSAGAHIALCSLLEAGDEPDEDLSVSSRPDGFALHFPVVGSLKGYGGDFFKEHPEYSPILHIEEGWPPIIISCGTKDALSDYSAIKKFVSIMKRKGNVCELISIKDADHTCDAPVDNPNFLPVITRMREFFKEQGLMP